MWAPEEGRGAVGGPWGARAEGGVAVVAPAADAGGAWFSAGANGGDDVRGMDAELFYEDDLEFQIASF